VLSLLEPLNGGVCVFTVLIPVAPTVKTILPGVMCHSDKPNGEIEEGHFGGSENLEGEEEPKAVDRGRY
jgi:hypothetical protein